MVAFSAPRAPDARQRQMVAATIAMDFPKTGIRFFVARGKMQKAVATINMDFPGNIVQDAGATITVDFRL